MKRYTIRKINNPLYGYVVFATSYENPFASSPEIEKSLAKKGYSGPVVFDLFLSTGVRDSRFLSAPFDGRCFSLRDLAPVQDESIAAFATNFYKTNFQKVDTTVLTKPSRFKLRKGLPV